MAGFGFSLGDVVTCSKLAVSAYTALKSAREDFEGLTLELLSLNTTLKALAEEATSPDSIINLATLQRQKSLQELLENCKNGLLDLDRLVSKYPSLGSGDKQKIIERIRFAAKSKQAPRDKLAIHTASINIFLTSLTHSSLGRLELQLKRALLQGHRFDEDMTIRFICNRSVHSSHEDFGGRGVPFIVVHLRRQVPSAWELSRH